MIDTNMPVREELPVFGPGDIYQVTGRSLLLFALKARGATRRIFERLGESLTSETPDAGTPDAAENLDTSQDAAAPETPGGAQTP